MTAKDEKEWYRKFYEGTFLIKGWRGRVEEILQGVPEDDKPQIAELLESLGKKIGSEWARDNNVRKIDSAMLQRWGNDLKAAGEKGPDDLVEKIRSINNDTDKLLA